MTHELSRDWTPVECGGNEQIPAVTYRGNRRVVTSELPLPVKPVVATTIHTSHDTAANWAATTELSRRGHLPGRDIVMLADYLGGPVPEDPGADPGKGDKVARREWRKAQARYVGYLATLGHKSRNEYRTKAPTKNWSELFRWYEQFQGTRATESRAYPAPEEREQLRVALEGAPYVVKVGERVCGMFAKREQAVQVMTRMGVRATLYHVGARFAWVEGATMMLPRSDRARGPSSVLAGQGTKIVRHKVVVGFDEHRIDVVGADRRGGKDGLGDMNGKERERDTFVTEKQWTRDTPLPSGRFDRVAGRWVSAA